MDVELQPGDCLADRYVILEEIGRGGFGVVYRAVQEGVNRHVALKTIRPQPIVIQGFDFVEAFRREALLTSKLKHPNTITLFDYGKTEAGMLYLVTEFLDGETLYERLWRDKEISPDTAVHVAKQIAKSLGEAHSTGIIHGDLKPANIFLCQMYGEEDFVKVLDFGIAKIIGEVDPAGLGTPEYMSPEQFSGQPLLAASDIYSLGLILYEMLVGARPFEDKDTKKLAERHLNEPLPPLPPEVDQTELGQVIRRATHKEPSRRYENGMALFKALNSLGTLRRPGPIVLPPANEPPPPPPPRPGASKRRRPTLKPSSIGSAGSRGSKRPEMPVVGRESERHWLFSRLESVLKRKQGRLVIVGGGAGVGKTRLCRWLIHEGAPVDALTGAGSFRTKDPRPFSAIADALAEALSLPRPTGTEHAAGRIERALADILGRGLSSVERTAVVGLFAPMTDGEPDARNLARLVLTLAQARPLVLHLDNLRNADEDSMAWLAAISDRLDEPGTSLLILATIRREALPSVPEIARRLKILTGRHREVVPWIISEMTDKDARSWAEQVLKRTAETISEGTPPTPHLIDAISMRSCGNPLYTSLLVEQLVERGALNVGVQGLQLSQGMDLEAMVPRRLGEMMRTRLQLILEEERDRDSIEIVLQRMALLGTEAPLTLLQSALGREAGDGSGKRAAQALAKLGRLLPIMAQRDLIAVKETLDPSGHPQRILCFTQRLLHQVLCAEMARSPDAALYHHHAAVAKRKHYAAQNLLDDHVHEIGTHYEKAGNAQEAVRFMLQAARSSVLGGNLNDAADVLERCRAICTDGAELANARLRIIVALSFLKLRLGAFADFEALQVLGQRLAGELGKRQALWELNLQAGIMALGAGRLEQADELLQATIEGFESKGAAPDPLPEDKVTRSLEALWLDPSPLKPAIGLAAALFYRSRVQRELLHLRNAGLFLRRAGLIFNQLGLTWGRALCMAELGELALERGQIDKGGALLQQATHMLGEVRPAVDLPDVQMQLSKALTAIGHLTPARELLTDVLTKLGPPPRPQTAQCHAALGQVLAALGLGEEALEHYEASIHQSRVHGARLTLLRNLIGLSGFLLEQHSFQRAASLLSEASKLAQGSRARRYTPRLQMLLGTLEERSGRLREASDWFDHCQRLTENSGRQLEHIRALSLSARLIQHEDAPVALETAEEQVEMATTLCKQTGALSRDLLRAQEALARAYARIQDPDRARDHLNQAIDGWQDLGNGNEVVRLQAVSAQFAP